MEATPELRWRDVSIRGINGRNSTRIRVYGLSSALVGNQVFVFGGSSPRKRRKLNKLYSLDLSQMEWRFVPIEGAPSPRVYHNMALVNDSLYIYGGLLMDDMYVCNIVHGTCFQVYQRDWSTEEEKDWRLNHPDEELWIRRQGRSGESLDFYEKESALVLYGGSRALDVQIFQVETNRWANVRTKGTFPFARSFHGSLLRGDRLFVNGGRMAIGNMNDIHVLTFLSKFEATWSTLLPYNEYVTGRTVGTINYYKGALIIYGGEISDGSYTTNIYFFDLASVQLQTESELSLLGGFESRGSHSAVALSNSGSFLVIGGLGDRNTLNNCGCIEIAW